MKLSDVLTERGYAFRQHLREEGWTRRKLTVIDLEPGQREALTREGPAGLQRELAARGLWPFPAADIQAPLASPSGLTLASDSAEAGAAAIVAPSGRLGDVADDIAARLDRGWDIRPTILSDDQRDLSLVSSRPLIVVGGAHENRFALDLAMRYQTFFLDAVAPGPDGWAVTTHLGLEVDSPGVIQLAADPGDAGEAIECLMGAIRPNGAVCLQPLHEISPGAFLRQHLPSWSDFTTGLARRVASFLRDPVEEVPEDPEPLSRLLAAGLDGGGPEVNRYNAPTIDGSISAARYYQLSGDRRALELFRALLFRLADYYLKTPEGASYPADFDFRLGQVILYYSRLEHDSVFGEADRLILVNLLLACSRSVYEYATMQWTPEPTARTRHNHETFPARTLTYAADYFERYDVGDVGAWRDYARLVFSGELWTRSKQKENAYGYETLAYEHAAAYSAYTGHGLDLFADGVLEDVVRRQIAATDNFLRATDYGDSHVATRSHGGEHVAAILATASDDDTVRWFAAEGGDRAPRAMAGALFSFPGIRRLAAGTEPESGGWEVAPADAGFLADYAPQCRKDRAFDKLAFRTDWGDGGHYVLLEGVGGQRVSHAHNEVNGIVRLNHRERMWVVSNGYGRRTGLTNVSESFNTRVRGPEDHNMLVLTRDGDLVRDLPAAAELLDRGQQGSLAWATCALWDYGGTHWLRSLVLVADVFLLVVDHLRVVDDGLEGAHIEWHCLGAARAVDGGCRLDQRGVFMDVLSTSAAPARLEVADRSAGWQQVLASDWYPHADFPLTRVICDLPLAAGGDSVWMATLLAATDQEVSPFELRREGDDQLRVDGPLAGSALVRTRHLGLRLDAKVLRLEVVGAPAGGDGITSAGTG